MCDGMRERVRNRSREKDTGTKKLKEREWR